MALRLDDGYADHPKVLALSDGAVRLHVRLMCYAAKHLTDGFIPARAVTATPRVVSELVTQRLLEPTDGGWMLHDFHDWNPKADRVKQIRKARAAAGSKGGSR